MYQVANSSVTEITRGPDDKIALFSFELDSDGAATILAEKQYRLVPVEDLTDEDLERYRLHSLQA